MSYEIRSNGSAGGNEFVRHFREAEASQAQQEREWIILLRSQGFKAAHPNDGWVDRERNTIQLVYPQFNDGVTHGDKIMLGWAWDKKSHRPVKVTTINYRRSFGLQLGSNIYGFEDL